MHLSMYYVQYISEYIEVDSCHAFIHKIEDIFNFM